MTSSVCPLLPLFEDQFLYMDMTLYACESYNNWLPCHRELAVIMKL